MNMLKIVGKDFFVGNEKYTFEDLYTEDFYPYSNSKADLFKNDLFCVNESYSSITQKYYAIEFFIKKHNVTFVDFCKADSVFKLFAVGICKQNGIKYKGSACWAHMKLSLFAAVYRFVSMGYLLYLMLRMPKSSDKIEVSEEFAVLRQKSAIQKFKAFDNISKEYEDPYSKISVYRFYSRWQRVIWVINAYIDTFCYRSKMKRAYCDLLGNHIIAAFDMHYQKRMVHGLLYGYLMDAYMSNFANKTYYTGSNLDRFSVIEDKIAKKYNIKTTCLPHGLEYGYKFPQGFSCDVFYANSQYAADHLNKLYNTSKYVYDDGITDKMFRLRDSAPHERNVVYFTEQQEVYVNKNILNAIIKPLSEKGIKVLVKLHPGDSKSNYHDCDFEYITDYAKAMTNNICVSRKSTVLLEAVYNNSTSIAIITTNKDRNVFETFPSLKSDKIIKTYSTDDLLEQILKHY